MRFLNSVFEAFISPMSKRVRSGGLVIISDTLCKTYLAAYRPAIPDRAGRLACGNRKCPAYFARVF
jgi:hypothetical protein